MESNGQFALIMDGTQDINGTEQISVSLRHVDDDLIIYEDFVGLYSVESTTGESLARVAKDVVLRLGLSMGNARAQTYDGASNMQGKNNGCGANIKKDHPLVLRFHCRAHAANLVIVVMWY